MGSDADEKDGLDELFSAVYEELRRLAAKVKRLGPNASINPTGLVNEAWLKLSKSSRLKVESRLHFVHIAALAMRRILIDLARGRGGQKRGGKVAFVTFDERVGTPASSAEEFLALVQALDDLARHHPRQAQVVELRFFVGLEVSEIATLLGIAEATVLRDWRFAKAWLASKLRKK